MANVQGILSCRQVWLNDIFLGDKMATYTINGFVIDEVGGTFNTVTSSTFEVVFSEGTSSYSYVLAGGTDPSGIPYADFSNTAVSSEIDGDFIGAVLDLFQTDEFLLQISWNSGANTAYVINFYGNSSEQS